MSRSFVDNDECWDASPRVYVNNMNTPHATMSLPERHPDNRVSPRGMGGMMNNAMALAGGGYSESRIVGANRGTSAGAHTYGVNGSGSGGASKRRGPHRNNDTNSAQTTVRGDAVHPNLQDVCNRIMRRLQRQMNYAELSRASLAEQYGVDLELRCEAEEAAVTKLPFIDDGKEHHGRRVGIGNTSNITNSSGAGPLAAVASPLSETSRTRPESEAETHGEDSRPSSQSFSLSVARIRLPGNTSNNTKGGARGGTSQLLQYKQQPLPAAGMPSITNVGVVDEEEGGGAGVGDGNRIGSSGGAARSDADVEREMAEQPCPRPLRLVVQHVLDTLQKKMTLAENGSLRDCIIFSFESRALLDRLLKEIPLYTQYTAYADAPGAGSNPSNHPAAMQQVVSGVCQQLRKRPVLLPRGVYVEDAATGAIRAELVSSGMKENDTQINENSHGAHGAGVLPSADVMTRLPNINVLPNAGGGNYSNTNNTNYNFSAQAALPEVLLPASYGKTTRLAASAGRTGSAAAKSSPLQQRRPSSQRSLRHPILHDHLSTMHSSVSIAADSFGDVRELMANGDAEHKYGSINEDSNANAYVASEAAAARRATQLVSIGTITDDNGVTTVAQTEYAALQRRVDELESQLADAQQHRSALAEQLCEEEQYTDQKKRIIQYLRETLVRECNMLRTQLHNITSAAAASAPPLPLAGKGGYGQRSTVNKESSMTIGGLNASTHSYAARQQKQSTAGGGGGGAMLSLSTTMAVSAVLQQQQQSADRPIDNNESLGNMHGGNASAAASAAGGRSGTGRTSPQFRHGGNNNNLSVGGTRGASNFPASAAAGAYGGGGSGGRTGAFQAEVDNIHSLLDLALLAVEEEAVLPPHTAQLLRSGYGDKDILRSGFRKNAKQQLDELRIDFEERQHALKKTLLQQTAEHNYVVAEQQSEVERLRALTDTSHVRAILQESVANIRAELQRVRMHVAEQLHFFKAILHSTGQGLLHRATLLDSTMTDNVALSSTLSATKELIESANSLFLPMLTHEYECGYHPWPLKVRNMRDPLGHILQLRFGTAEVVQLRDSLTEFGKLYVAMHQYVMAHAVLPESTRPTTGKLLEDLCAALALNPVSPTEIVFAARRCHDVEGQLRKKLARLQSRILWNSYLQRVYTERSVAALSEAGIDPRVAALPVARCIDVLTQQRGDLLQARVKLQHERSENAKELFRLWREKEIDIMEGYPTPQTQRNRLTLPSNNNAFGAGAGAARTVSVDGGAATNTN